ncbi:MAG TPA: hypothetical protein VF066_05120 [Thermoleophilaceae bacterium]
MPRPGLAAAQAAVDANQSGTEESSQPGLLGEAPGRTTRPGAFVFTGTLTA